MPTAKPPTVFELEHRLEADHWWFKARLARILELIESTASSCGLILDVGCGSGFNARTLGRLGRVVGVDLESGPLLPDRERGQWRLAANALQLPFRDGVFHLVTAFDVIEHIQADRHALHELIRVLKPQGFLVLTTPALPLLYGAHDRALGHFRRYTRSELEKKARQAGSVTAVRISYFLSLLFGPLLGWRLLSKVLVNTEGSSDGSRGLPRWANGLLGGVMSLEHRVSRYVPLPFGGSLIALFRKRG